MMNSASASASSQVRWWSGIIGGRERSHRRPVVGVEQPEVMTHGAHEPERAGEGCEAADDPHPRYDPVLGVEGGGVHERTDITLPFDRIEGCLEQLTVEVGGIGISENRERRCVALLESRQHLLGDLGVTNSPPCGSRCLPVDSLSCSPPCAWTAVKA